MCSTAESRTADFPTFKVAFDACTPYGECIFLWCRRRHPQEVMYFKGISSPVGRTQPTNMVITPCSKFIR